MKEFLSQRKFEINYFITDCFVLCVSAWAVDDDDYDKKIIKKRERERESRMNAAKITLVTL